MNQFKIVNGKIVKNTSQELTVEQAQRIISNKQMLKTRYETLASNVQDEIDTLTTLVETLEKEE